jgi:hypothetical protein
VTNLQLIECHHLRRPPTIYTELQTIETDDVSVTIVVHHHVHAGSFAEVWVDVYPE